MNSSWGFRIISSWFLGSARVFRSEAEILCLLLFALQDPTPVRFIAWVSLFFSCCLVVFCPPSSSVSLSLSSSGAGETQTALQFVVPLVSLRPAHALRLQPVHRAPHFPPGVAPAPAVFFVFGLFSLSASRSLYLSLSISLSLSLV